MTTIIYDLLNLSYCSVEYLTCTVLEYLTRAARLVISDSDPAQSLKQQGVSTDRAAHMALNLINPADRHPWTIYSSIQYTLSRRNIQQGFLSGGEIQICKYILDFQRMTPCKSIT